MEISTARKAGALRNARRLAGPSFSFALLVISLFGLPVPASAQIFEAVGSRALGMGGAFVAVASDSSATWWNPAGLADGPFVDVALARATTERLEPAPAGRERTSWFALATPVVGVSYYRLRVTHIQPSSPTGDPSGGREDRAAEVGIQSSSVSQLGATILQTLFPGVHVGTTLKYVRGTVRSGQEPADRSAGDLLTSGESLEGGDAEGHFDLDIGVLAVAGPVRLGGVVRNLKEPEFAAGQLRLERQVRLGAAVDIEKAGGPPLMLAVDGDAKSYATGSGERQVVAAGAEQWLFARRVGLRAGARVNRVGAKERSVTGGVSFAARSGMYLEGHIVRGGSPEERGWGAAVRISF